MDNLRQTWLAFLGYTATPYILSLLAIGELINDKLPKTPSRKAPASFGARIVMRRDLRPGSSPWRGLRAGSPEPSWADSERWPERSAGYEVRSRLVKALGVPDYVIALIEDAIAVGGGFLIVSRFP